MAEAVTTYHSLKLSDSEMNVLLRVKIGEKKFIASQITCCLVTSVLLCSCYSPERKMGSLHCVAQQRNEQLTKSQEF